MSDPPTKSKKQLLCSDGCILMGVDFVGPKVSEPPISWPWGSSSHEPPKIHMQNGSFTHNCVIECISLCHKKCARLRLCPRSHWRSLQCFPKFPSQLGRLKALPHPRQTPLPSEPQSSCLQRSKWTSWCQCSYYQVSWQKCFCPIRLCLREKTYLFLYLWWHSQLSFNFVIQFQKWHSMYMYLDDRWQRYSKNNKGDAFFLRNSIEMRRLYFHYKYGT